MAKDTEKDKDEKDPKDKSKKDKETPIKVEHDPKSGLPLRTGDPLIDDVPPYGVPKDKKTREPLEPSEEDKAKADKDAEGENGDEADDSGMDPVVRWNPERPDPDTLTMESQNRYEVLTGERVQKPEEEPATKGKKAGDKSDKADKAEAKDVSAASRPVAGHPAGTHAPGAR